MGAAWCRDRAAAANNSKSPLDRVIVQCVNQIYPSAENRRNSVNNEDTDGGAVRVKTRPLVSYPVPVHTRHRPISATHALNASSKWEDASLSVPDTPDEHGTPIPPPRKKKIWREQQRQQQLDLWKTVQRPPPPQPPPPQPPSAEVGLLGNSKKKRRQKTLSTVSLPNYNDLSLSVYTAGNSEKPGSGLKTPPRNESFISLPGKSTGLSSLSEATVEKIESCVRRCRSFGAFKPEQLKIKSSPVNGRLSSESDDSFDGLDDWDLRVIEHCEAHEISPPHTLLPPQRLRRTPQQMLLGKDEDASAKDETQKRLNVEPEENSSTSDGKVDRATISELTSDSPSTRSTDDKSQELRTESDATKVVVYDFVTPKKQSTEAKTALVNGFHESESAAGMKTPPPTPENIKPKNADKWVDDQTTHSSLLRLLKEYQTTEGKLEDSGAQQVLRDLGLPPTLRDSVDQLHKGTCASRGSSGRSSMTPSLSELEAALSDLLEASASRDDEDDVTPVSMATSTPVHQPLSNLRVISPKPFTAFSSSFHPVQTSQGSQETTA